MFAQEQNRLAKELTPEQRLDMLLAHLAKRGLQLYAWQEEALLELFAGKNLIVNTPTGSGKTLVASAMAFKAISEGKRCVYTAPIKALVNEKFFSLCEEFGAEQIGVMTGDASVNRDASVVCCTAEILENWALRFGNQAPIDYVVMDEFHFYADRGRGVSWQVPLLTLPQTTFALLSATLGDASFFTRVLTERNQRETVWIRTAERPVPLSFEYRQTPLHETIADLLNANRAPVYVVHFTHRAAAEHAQDLMSTDVLTKEEKRRIHEELYGFRFDTPYGKEVQRFLKHGIAIHHAGLLPKYRRLVERLAQQGLLKLICGTDTLGVGINVPIRSVLFTQLCKYDGERSRLLTVRAFKQIAGRAGRKGFDEQGYVFVQAPAHVIENKVLQDKAGGDAKKLRKIVYKKPPTRGYVHWDQSTFERMVQGDPETLQSSFEVNPSMLLQVLSRDADGCHAMKEIIRGCHDSAAQKRGHARHAIAIFRSLVQQGVVEYASTEGTASVRIHADLQEDFALHQTLALYAVEGIKKLNRDDLDYALQALSVIESVVEDPDIILVRQLDKIKEQRMEEMKLDGVEYEDRMKELETLQHPKPLADFLYATFDEFAAAHPWVGKENVRPKSVVREMVENLASFAEYIKEYGLHREEGVLLRYLFNVYRALVQTVPEKAKTEELHEVIEWLGVLVRGVDSSLLDEWERLQGVEAEQEAPSEKKNKSASDITTNRRTFVIALRNEIWPFLRALAKKDYANAAHVFEPSLKAEALESVMEGYWNQHGEILLDAEARSLKHTQLDISEERWLVRQVFIDPEEDRDWCAEFTIDVETTKAEGRPVLLFSRVAEVGSDT